MRPPLLLLLLLAPTVAFDANAQSLDERYDSAIEAAVAAAEPRLVRLRYFGDAGDSLGASAAPVTGWRLGAGWVLTSDYGLASEPAAIVGQSLNGESSQYALVAHDHSRRLVLMRKEAANGATPPVTAESRPARVGETAIALGAVYSAEGASVSVGVVSATARHGGRSVQTDAAISPANYGGPLVGLDGALLGVIVPLAPSGMRGVELYDSGIGFAIPPSEFSPRLGRMAAGESIQPGWLGARFKKDDPLRARPVVSGVVEGGPAAVAGVIEGATVRSLGGAETPSVWRLQSLLGGLDAGQSVPVEIQHASGVQETVQLVLGERPSEPPSAERKQEEPDEP